MPEVVELRCRGPGVRRRAQPNQSGSFDETRDMECSQSARSDKTRHTGLPTSRELVSGKGQIIGIAHAVRRAMRLLPNAKARPRLLDSAAADTWPPPGLVASQTQRSFTRRFTRLVFRIVAV